MALFGQQGNLKLEAAPPDSTDVGFLNRLELALYGPGTWFRKVTRKRPFFEDQPRPSAAGLRFIFLQKEGSLRPAAAAFQRSFASILTVELAGILCQCSGRQRASHKMQEFGPR